LGAAVEILFKAALTWLASQALTAVRALSAVGTWLHRRFPGCPADVFTVCLSYSLLYSLHTFVFLILFTQFVSSIHRHICPHLVPSGMQRDFLLCSVCDVRFCGWQTMERHQKTSTHIRNARQCMFISFFLFLVLVLLFFDPSLRSLCSNATDSAL